jgi:hypothetical protein
MSDRNFPKPISQEAQKVLERLIDGVDYDHSRKLDNGGAGIMAAVVEQVGPEHFSVAHYYEQNGDLMADPDVVFWRHAGRYYPAEYTQHGLGIHQELIAFEDGRAVRFMARAQPSCASFCATWMRNIKHQQGGLRALSGGLRGPDDETAPPDAVEPSASEPEIDPDDVSMFDVN